jgi:ABC-type transport system involved in multi-copper enzyme maturation permease subunit
MAPALQPPGFLGTTLLLFGREVRAKLASLWLYAVASAVCLIVWAYGVGLAQTFQTGSVLVTTDPLMALNVLVVAFLGVVLGLRLSASTAWEREHRTLEVLVVGPVSFEAIVLAKFLVELCVFTVLIAIYVLYLLFAQPLGAGVIGLSRALSVGQMPLHALPTLALGLLVSSLARTVRGAVVVYLVVVLCLGLFEIVHGFLLAHPPEELSLAEAHFRAALQGVAAFLDPISAIARLADLADGLTVQTPLIASKTLLALALTFATLASATILSRVRGALG